MAHHRVRLSVPAFGFASGMTWAVGVLVMGWVSWLTGWAKSMIVVMGSVYLGYQATFWGSVIGALWGFADLFIAGIVLAAIYNACVCGKGCNHEIGPGGM